MTKCIKKNFPSPTPPYGAQNFGKMTKICLLGFYSCQWHHFEPNPSTQFSSTFFCIFLEMQKMQLIGFAIHLLNYYHHHHSSQPKVIYYSSMFMTVIFFYFLLQGDQKVLSDKNFEILLTNYFLLKNFYNHRLCWNCSPPIAWHASNRRIVF